MNQAVYSNSVLGEATRKHPLLNPRARYRIIYEKQLQYVFLGERRQRPDSTTIKKVRSHKLLLELMRNKTKPENGLADEDIVVEFVELDGGKRGHHVHEVFRDDLNLRHLGWFEGGLLLSQGLVLRGRWLEHLLFKP